VNAPAANLPAANLRAASPPTPSTRLERQDGWTPDAQRAFLEAVAEGHTVEAACRIVGLSFQSAYALRRRAAGASFALGWQAASLLARNRLADALVCRAIDGQVETVTRPDGSTFTRHRFDNRLATAMLTRLDRFADQSVAEGTHAAARLVAQEFDAFLDLIERDDGPARAGLFVGLRLGDVHGPGERDGAAAADLAPVVALARADRWCRTGAALAGDVVVADLDPAQRAHWTAEQWARAEAAGLLVLAAPDAPDAANTADVPDVPDDGGSGGPDDRAHDLAAGGGAGGGWNGVAGDINGNPQLPQPLPKPHPQLRRDFPADDPVWWDDAAEEWRTSFPPPDNFLGEEEGEFGDADYARALNHRETLIANSWRRIKEAPIVIAAGLARDAWFEEAGEQVIDYYRTGPDDDEAGDAAASDTVSGAPPG